MRKQRIVTFSVHVNAIMLSIFLGTANSQELNEFVPSLDRGGDLMAKGDEKREALVNFSIKGRVKTVEDGDTITIVGIRGAKFIIRLSDMDTPEVSHEEFTPADCQCKTIPFRQGQPGGKAATSAIMGMISIGDSVRAECYELDQYGRSVCHVFKGGENINLEQIKLGWGWLPTKMAWIRDPKSKPAEDAARKAKLGAWGLPKQVSPSDWRKNCWGASMCDGAEN